MAKHRGTVYTVVREVWKVGKADNEGTYYGEYIFSAIVGAYTTLMRAEEVMGASAQALRDAGAADGDYRFSVKAVTYYDE